TGSCTFHLVYYPFYLLCLLLPHRPTLFPYTTLFRSIKGKKSDSKLAVLLTTAVLKTTVSPYLISTAPSACLASSPFSTITFLPRSEEHTSELQSRFDLVCRLLLEKKNI